MILRLGALLLLLVAGAPYGRAETFTGATSFNASLANSVYAAALGFIVPRALDAVTMPELTLWGLQGLAALDPDLSVALGPDRLTLIYRQQPILTVQAPRFDDAAGWAAVATATISTAWRYSDSVRRAGTQGVVTTFFAELCGHLDPYSRYVSPDAAVQDEAQRLGSAGVGLVLQRQGRTLRVVKVRTQSPAEGAGLHPGSVLLSVDGRMATGEPVSTVATWLSGSEGSSVKLAWRSGRTQQSATLVREIIPPETVFPETDDDLLVLRVTGFSHETEELFSAAIQQAIVSSNVPGGLVIDLRGNRGGLLGEAVMLADTLLPSGIVTITEGRDPAANRIWRSYNGEEVRGVPVVILVDADTASAAEVLAAALADRGRAVVVGSSTTGKGLVQTFTTLPDGGELFISWSRVLAPRGWPIQGLGVLPQVCTSLGQEALVRQLTALSAGQQPEASVLLRDRNARAPVPANEIVAIRSACPAASGTEADMEVAHYLVEDPAAYAAALLPPMNQPMAAGP